MRIKSLESSLGCIKSSSHFFGFKFARNKDEDVTALGEKDKIKHNNYNNSHD